MTLGERIKKRRLELGLTQEELALKLGYVSKATISNAEHDRDDMTTTRIAKYAEALGVTPAYLMGWEDTPSDDLVKLASTYEKNNGDYYSIEIEYKQDNDRMNRLLKYASILNEDGVNDLIRYAKLLSKDDEYIKEDKL